MQNGIELDRTKEKQKDETYFLLMYLPIKI